ncbi:unnamed protein product, partial [Diabrotica balteata]
AIITVDNHIEKEVSARIAAGNRALYSSSILLRSKLLKIKSKLTLYKSIIRSMITYGSKTWTLNQREINKLLVFERKVLRIIFGAQRDEFTENWRRRRNAELVTLYGTENIVRHIKANRIRW